MFPSDKVVLTVDVIIGFTSAFISPDVLRVEARLFLCEIRLCHVRLAASAHWLAYRLLRTRSSSTGSRLLARDRLPLLGSSRTLPLFLGHQSSVYRLAVNLVLVLIY